MTRRRGRACTLALTVVLAILLAGCGAIPTSGAVQVGEVHDSGGPGDVSLTPVGPVAGAAQADVVRGFIAAAVGVQQDYAVAREFLAPSLAKRWNPHAGVLLHDGGATVTQQSQTEVTLDVTTVGEVDAYGSYRAANANRVEHFTLERVSGQWRISAAPDGIVLSDVYFSRLFSPRALAFFDPLYRRLVPDVRWFASGSGMVASIVQALVAGASAPLAAPVTATGFPQGASVHVSTRSGDLVVDLTGTGRRPSDLDVARMRYQLIESLRQQSIGDVTLEIDGVQRDVAPVTLAAVSSAAHPVLLRDGVLGTQRGDTFTSIGALGKAVAALDPTAVTVSSGQQLAAVLTDSGVVAVTSTAHRTVDSRPALVAPSLDQDGWVWSVPASSPNAFRASDLKGDQVDVQADLGDAVQVISIEVSRDGARLLVLYQTVSGYGAMVAGIARSADGTPVALRSAHFTIPVDGTAIAATWADDTSVAVLTEGSGGADSVVVTQVGGRQSSRGQLSGAVALTGGDSQTELVALLRNRDVWTQVSGSWRSLGAQAALLAVQR